LHIPQLAIGRKCVPKEQSGEVDAGKREVVAISAAPATGGVVMRIEIQFGRKVRVVSSRV